jgi:hypothetical protein
MRNRFDASQAHLADFWQRALRHHAEGIFWAEEVFGHTITNADGRAVPLRFIAEQHVKKDLGWIPTLADWFKHPRVQSWMARVGDLQVARDKVPPAAGEPPPMAGEPIACQGEMHHRPPGT